MIVHRAGGMPATESLSGSQAEHCDAGVGLEDREHEVQLMFQVSAFLMLSPGTYTGRIMSTEVQQHPQVDSSKRVGSLPCLAIIFLANSPPRTWQGHAAALHLPCNPAGPPQQAISNISLPHCLNTLEVPMPELQT